MNYLSRWRGLIVVNDEVISEHVKCLCDYLAGLSDVIHVDWISGPITADRSLDSILRLGDSESPSAAAFESMYETRNPLIINLSKSDVSWTACDCIEFIVEEGVFEYRLSVESAGWGSVIANCSIAKVRAIRRSAISGDWLVIGEAEVRTNRARPDFNSLQIGGAAVALIRQGCLGNGGSLVERTREFEAPSPSILSIARRWIRRAVRGVDSRLRRRQRQWNIGVVSRSDVIISHPFPWPAVTWLDPPVDGFIADPFLARERESDWLFYERLLYRENQGTLWVAKLNTRSGELSDAREILRLDVHLSFPNVFKYGDHWYMLPEQARSGATVLYRAVTFPYEWTIFHTLLPEFPGIDPVLVHHEGRWWLFVSYGAHPCTDNNLFLFSAVDLKGEWVPHPMNPIKSGLRGSRMAGPISRDATMLIRPGQNCYEGYGMGLVLYEILQLDLEIYLEREIASWLPQTNGVYYEGFHHYMNCGDLLAIDGQRYRKIE